MVPFSLDKRTNPEGCIHFMLPNQLDELHQVIFSFKIELALNWFMTVPENIRLNQVQTSMFSFYEEVGPGLNPIQQSKSALHASIKSKVLEKIIKMRIYMQKSIHLGCCEGNEWSPKREVLFCH